MTRPELDASLQALWAATQDTGMQIFHAEKAPWEDQLRWLASLREVLAELHWHERTTEGRLAKGMPENRVVAGRIVAERSVTWSYKNWDSAELAKRLVDATNADPFTGEVGDRATAERVQSAFLHAARLEWRVSVLRALGVDFSELAEHSQSRPRIKLY